MLSCRVSIKRKGVSNSMPVGPVLLGVRLDVVHLEADVVDRPPLRGGRLVRGTEAQMHARHSGGRLDRGARPRLQVEDLEIPVEQLLMVRRAEADVTAGDLDGCVFR